MQPLKTFCNLFFKLTLPVGTSRKLLRNGVSLSIGSIFSLVLKREMWSFYIQDGTFKFQHFWNLSTLEYQISVGHGQLFQYPVISGVNAESSLLNLTILWVSKRKKLTLQITLKTRATTTHLSEEWFRLLTSQEKRLCPIHRCNFQNCKLQRMTTCF